MTVVIVDREVRLKRHIRDHFRKLGFTRDERGDLKLDNLSKDTYRAFHLPQRLDKLARNADFIEKNSASLIEHFADGVEIDPQNIKPRLEIVSAGTWQSDLFRFASLQWQIPVSDGYGRRMRFLVWDATNEKLIGLIALGDAVFNLAVRDQLVGWDHEDRGHRLANLMDAYVLGAVPPYNLILGGKLVASLVRTQEIRRMFEKRYGNSIGLISGERKNARLAMVTTTSALGRSSVYNRLKLHGVDYFKSIGFTSGWGHFHISDALFHEIRRYLEDEGDPYANGHEFGNGPNWRLRTIRRALSKLGMSEGLMKHRLVREVFVCKLATNARNFLQGKATRARFGDQLLTVEEVGEKAVHRWVTPRAERDDTFRLHLKSSLLQSLDQKFHRLPNKNAARSNA